LRRIIDLLRFLKNGHWWSKFKILFGSSSFVDLVPPTASGVTTLIHRSSPVFVDGDLDLWNRTVNERQYGRELSIRDRGVYRGPCFSILSAVFVSKKGWDLDSLQGSKEKVPKWADVVALVKPQRIKEPVILLNLLWADNYFHWMLEVLPRLSSLGILSQSVKVLLPVNVKSFHSESLLLAGIPQGRQVRPTSSWIELEDAIYVGSLGPTGNPTPLALRWMRKNLVRVTQSMPIGKPLFVYRDSKASRGILNLQECLSWMERRGYLCVEPGSMRVAEQIEVFRTASCVVGLHGAGLANLAFCPSSERLKVLEILTEDWPNGCFWALSNVLEAQYCCLFVESDGSGKVSLDLMRLERVLDRWEQL